MRKSSPGIAWSSSEGEDIEHNEVLPDVAFARQKAEMLREEPALNRLHVGGMSGARAVRTALLLCLLPSLAFAQANGKLQIHQLNIGQGDAALIISPLGETMLIDTGPTTASSCQSATGIITQLVNIGLTRLDYHVASHYHADHIGCDGRCRSPPTTGGTANLPGTQVYALGEVYDEADVALRPTPIQPSRPA